MALVAVTTVLGFVVGKMAQYGSSQAMLVPYPTSSTRFNSAFARNDVPMTWDFYEANFFGKVGGTWTELVGTALRFYGVTDSNHGIATIAIDNGPEVDVDQYSSARSAQALLFTSGQLPPGEHVATIRVSGRKNTKSRYMWVTVDRIEIDP